MKRLTILFLTLACLLPAKAAYVAHPDQHLLEGDWMLHTIYGQKATGDNRPHIEIELSHMRFYGSTGCNVVNGSIALSKEDCIRFTDVVSTKMHCENAPFEYLINTSFDKVRYYKITRHGQEYYLDLLNDQHHEIMTLRKHNMDFLNGIWEVEEIDGTPNLNPGIRIAIDIQGDKIHGHTGCNVVNGNITLDPDKSNAIQFSNLVSTYRACADQTESLFLIALEEVVAAFPAPTDTDSASASNSASTPSNSASTPSNSATEASNDKGTSDPDRVTMTNSRGRTVLILRRQK